MSHWERRLYGWLLLFYPSRFRRRYGGPMLQAYRDRRAHAVRQGPGALLSFWREAVSDAVANGVAERRLARRRPSSRRPARASLHRGLLGDVRQAWRHLHRQPGLTAAALLTLGLGVGANTTVFSAVSGLLGPLPFPESGRLVQVWQSAPDRGIQRGNVTPAAVADWQARSDLFEALGAFVYTSANITDTQPAERLTVAYVTPGFFEALGIRPVLGRTLAADDVTPGASPVIVISAATWQARFGGRADVLGETMRLGSTPHAIVGVMPAAFEHLSWRGAAFWAPLVLDPADRRSAGYRVVARLQPAGDAAAVEDALSAAAAERSRTFGPDEWPAGVVVTSLHEGVVGDTAGALLMTQAIAVVVLVIACANIANLLLARAVRRRHEYAVRASLGAGRWQLIRQGLVESLMLSLAGGAAGLLVASWGISVVVSYAPAEMPRLDQIRLDGTVLSAAFVLTSVTGLVSGLVPAIRLARSGIDGTTIGVGRSGATTRQRPLQGLAVVQIALAVAVVAVSTLLARSLITLQQVDVGLRGDVVAAEVSLPQSSYATSDAQRAMFDRMVASVAALPGVEAAGVVDALPLTQSWNETRYRLEADPDSRSGSALTYRASRDYFDVVGIPLHEGRLFDVSDATGPPVVLVSATVARRHWADGSALGRPLWLQGIPVTFTIVGVVGDVRHRGIESGPEAGLYFSTSQVAPFRGVLVARTTGDPRSVIRPMRAAVAALDPALPLFNTRTIEDLRADALSAPRLITSLTGLFAALSLALGLVGIYGLVSFTVSTRMPEAGLRMALGASAGDVAKLFIRRGLLLSASGLTLGLLLAVVAGRALAGIAAGVPGPGPALLIGLALVLGAATLLACVLPARRVRRADPTVLLRQG